MATTTRRKAVDDIARARARALSHLRREANANRQRALDEAAAAIKRAQTTSATPDPQVSLARVILDHAQSVTMPVLASLGLTPDMSVTISKSGAAQASTDYQRIDVAIPLDDFPTDYPSPAEVTRLVAITKGLIYHEAGHLLFSVPFAHLVRTAAQQGCQLPREFTDSKYRVGLGRFSWVQNILEDQRMECAMVRVSPVFENHFRVTASHMLLAPAFARGRIAIMWPYLCGRTYLPKNLLSALRADAVKEATNLGLIDAFHTIEAGVRAYKRATTERELMEAVLTTVKAFGDWFDDPMTVFRSNIDTHHDPGTDVNEAVRRSLNESASGASTGDDEVDDESAEPFDTPADGVEGARAIRSLVADTARDAVASTAAKVQIDEMLKAFNVVMGRGLPRDPSIAPMAEEEKRQAHEVKAGMLDVLEPLMSRSDPGWAFRQEDGVLDPVSFTLRSPGETDYWANSIDDLSPGRDIAVSLVLDVSYSMSQQIDELSIAVVGVRLACDELRIPCTVTTFADSASLLFDASEQTEEVKVSCQGGTEPLQALEDLCKQRHGKALHLAVVFTDGEWFGVPSMGPFRQPGATYLGVSLGEAARQTLGQRNFDAVASIDRARDLVIPVQRLLVETAASP